MHKDDSEEEKKHQRYIIANRNAFHNNNNEMCMNYVIIHPIPNNNQNYLVNEMVYSFARVTCILNLTLHLPFTMWIISFYQKNGVMSKGVCII